MKQWAHDELAERLVESIAGHHYRYDDEDDLQRQVASVVSETVPCVREVHLTSRDRADIMAGSILIEVKIGGTRPAVLRQLHRYAMCDQVAAIILVSDRSRHLAVPKTFNGKPVHIASLLGGAF